MSSDFPGWAAGRHSVKMILRRLKPGSRRQSLTSLNSTRMCPKVPLCFLKRSSVATLGKQKLLTTPHPCMLPILSLNIWILTVWSSTGPVPPLRTASITPGFKMPTWCAFVGRLSPLQLPVSRNSWPTSSAGERWWPPSTKFSCGPTRALHKPPPAPPRQMCQLHPPHLSPSENRLPNTSWRDFKTRLWAVRLGCPFRFELLNLVGKKKKRTSKKPAVAVIYRDVTSFCFLVLKEDLKEHRRELLVTRAWLHFFYGGLVHTRQDVVFKLVPQGL